MSSADEAAAALRASKAINHGQQALTEESRDLLTSFIRREFGDQMRLSVAEGLEAVLTSEAVWAKVVTVLQKQARERTGRFVLGGVTAVLRKAVWVAVFAGVAYAIGGWTLLKAVWTALMKG